MWIGSIIDIINLTEYCNSYEGEKDTIPLITEN